MGKESRRENRRNRRQQPVAPTKQAGSRWFIAVVTLILLAGAAVVALLASQHESVAGVSPEVTDHWHDAYLIHACGTDLPPSTVTDDPAGLHTHGRGLVHIHPFNPTSAGPNATLEVFVNALGAEMTDDSYTPGPGEDPTVLSEEAGCDGEPATLQLAYWADAWSDAEPEIITDNIAGFRLGDEPGGALTLALLPEGAEIPKPPQDRLDVLEQTQGGRNPSETDAETDDADADADAETDDEEPAES